MSKKLIIIGEETYLRHKRIIDTVGEERYLLDKDEINKFGEEKYLNDIKNTINLNQLLIDTIPEVKDAVIDLLTWGGQEELNMCAEGSHTVFESVLSKFTMQNLDNTKLMQRIFAFAEDLLDSGNFYRSNCADVSFYEPLVLVYDTKDFLPFIKDKPLSLKCTKYFMRERGLKYKHPDNFYKTYKEVYDLITAPQSPEEAEKSKKLNLLILDKIPEAKDTVMEVLTLSGNIKADMSMDSRFVFEQGLARFTLESMYKKENLQPIKELAERIFSFAETLLNSGDFFITECVEIFYDSLRYLRYYLGYEKFLELIKDKPKSLAVVRAI